MTLDRKGGGLSWTSLTGNNRKFGEFYQKPSKTIKGCREAFVPKSLNYVDRLGWLVECKDVWGTIYDDFRINRDEDNDDGSYSNRNTGGFLV